jgi:hypothetical protein
VLDVHATHGKEPKLPIYPLVASPSHNDFLKTVEPFLHDIGG